MLITLRRIKGKKSRKIQWLSMKTKNPRGTMLDPSRELSTTRSSGRRPQCEIRGPRRVRPWSSSTWALSASRTRPTPRRSSWREGLAPPAGGKATRTSSKAGRPSPPTRTKGGAGTWPSRLIRECLARGRTLRPTTSALSRTPKVPEFPRTGLIPDHNNRLTLLNPKTAWIQEAQL